MISLNQFPILLIIMLSPVIGSIAVWFAPNGKTVKYIAAFFASISLVLSILAYVSYDKTMAGMQFIFEIPWIKATGVNLSLGVDGISMPMVLLTAIILFCGVFVSWKLEDRPKEFFFYMLFLWRSIRGIHLQRLFCFSSSLSWPSSPNLS